MNGALASDINSEMFYSAATSGTQFAIAKFVSTVKIEYCEERQT